MLCVLWCAVQWCTVLCCASHCGYAWYAHRLFLHSRRHDISLLPVILLLYLLYCCPSSCTNQHSRDRHHPPGAFDGIQCEHILKHL